MVSSNLQEIAWRFLAGTGGRVNPADLAGMAGFSR